MKRWLLLACIGAPLSASAAQRAEPGRTWPKVEIRFEIPDLTGNPFDFQQNDVRAAIRTPKGQVVKAPAFFDGGSTWRVRYTPLLPGHYAVTGITRNGSGIKVRGLEPTSFTAKGKAAAGFIRKAGPKGTGFAFDNGEPYYPLGHNVAWGDPDPLSVPRMLTKMGAVGENWARIWMDHWDGKNLDWVDKKTVPLGKLDLDVARRWDGIIATAEKSGIRIQMVLQHHGQYTSAADSNWAENPWNVKNGGFLANPSEFFTNARAITLTQAKYRYIIARWGYSSNVLAWELFNEVEWTDPVRDGHPEIVAAWHNGMVDFIRRQDPNRHLITSSSGIRNDMLGGRLDYWQPHFYLPDPLDSVSRLNHSGVDRPAFIGEIGLSFDQPKGDPAFLRKVIWGSLMSEAAGAASYWAWDYIDRENLYGAYRPAGRFVTWSGMSKEKGLEAVSARVETVERGPLTFSPGTVWDKITQSEFEIGPTGEIAGLVTLPRFLQGTVHRDMGTSVAFSTTMPGPGTFSIHLAQVAKAGARLTVTVDGQPVEEKPFPATAADATIDVTVPVPLTTGRHTVGVENTGADWLVVDRYTLDPFTSRMGAVGKRNARFATFWVYKRQESALPMSGRLIVTGFAPGRYRVSWWDTTAGKVIQDGTISIGADRMLTAPTPEMKSDAAVVIRRVEPSDHKTAARVSGEASTARER